MLHKMLLLIEGRKEKDRLVKKYKEKKGPEEVPDKDAEKPSGRGSNRTRPPTGWEMRDWNRSN